MSGYPMSESPTFEYSLPGCPMSESPLSGYPLSGYLLSGYLLSGCLMSESPLSKYLLSEYPLSGYTLPEYPLSEYTLPENPPYPNCPSKAYTVPVIIPRVSSTVINTQIIELRKFAFIFISLRPKVRKQDLLRYK